ncbi:hypothetical protein [Luteitalea pratensis]|nr:hypothetical protein [Luteitalea pratensis]
MLARPLGVVIACALALVLSGCSMLAGPESGFIITLEDPAGRLGPPPWSVAVFNPYFGPEQARTTRTAGSAGPDKPFEVLVRSRMESWRIQDRLVGDRSTVFGLVLPSLRADGYWLARVDHALGGFSGTGSARFCRWGRVEPDEDSEELPIVVRHRKDAPGLQLETRVRIPAQPRSGPSGRP